MGRARNSNYRNFCIGMRKALEGFIIGGLACKAEWTPTGQVQPLHDETLRGPAMSRKSPPPPKKKKNFPTLQTSSPKSIHHSKQTPAKTHRRDAVSTPCCKLPKPLLRLYPGLMNWPPNRRRSCQQHDLWHDLRRRACICSCQATVTVVRAMHQNCVNASGCESAPTQPLNRTTDQLSIKTATTPFLVPADAEVAADNLRDILHQANGRS